MAVDPTHKCGFAEFWELRELLEYLRHSENPWMMSLAPKPGMDMDWTCRHLLTSLTYLPRVCATWKLSFWHWTRPASPLKFFVGCYLCFIHVYTKLQNVRLYFRKFSAWHFDVMTLCRDHTQLFVCDRWNCSNNVIFSSDITNTYTNISTNFDVHIRF